MNIRTRTRRMLLILALALTATGALSAAPAYRLQVDGLACPFCTYGIEKKLGALAGVERLETNIEDGSVIVIMRDGMSLDEASAREAVNAAGFSLRKFEPLPPGAGEGD